MYGHAALAATIQGIPRTRNTYDFDVVVVCKRCGLVAQRTLNATEQGQREHSTSDHGAKVRSMGLGLVQYDHGAMRLLLRVWSFSHALRATLVF